MPVSNKIGGNTFAAKLLSGIDSVVGGGRGMRQANASNSGKHMLCNVALWGCLSSRPDKTERFPPVTDKNRRRLQRHKKALALPGFPWVADLLMSFPEGTNEGYGPIFSDSRADRALVC